MKSIGAVIFPLVACFLLLGRSFGFRPDNDEEEKPWEYGSVERIRELKGNVYSHGSSLGKAHTKGGGSSKGKGTPKECKEGGKSRKGRRGKKGSKCEISQTTPWGCDPFSDPCPGAFKLDGICRNVPPEWDPDHSCVGIMADCLDCDPCSAFHYTSCSNCTSHDGCFWCPGDALCYSTPWVKYPLNPMNPVYGPISSCRTEADWLTMGSCSSKSSRNRNVFTDPLYDSDDWAFKILNVESVWKQGITGKGVHIRINDEGVDANHPEFAGKFDFNASCDVFLPANSSEPHGTICASIAAARGDNDVCAVGIAPDATLSSCKINGVGGLLETGEGYSFLTHALLSQDISSNSWGTTPCKRLPETGSRRMSQECPFLAGPETSPCLECDFTAELLDGNCTDAILNYCSNWYNYDTDLACIEYLELFTTCHFNGISQDLQAHLTMAIKQGRKGKGLIIVFAASNENNVGSYSSFDGKQSSRFIICVGAVGKDRKHASYSTVGPSVLVSAPGGDIESRSNWIAATPFGGCNDWTMGTSYATPATAGVIALMLQVNPDLGWRDVQGILVATSQIVDPKDESWVINGAGFHHSYEYGFGIVDAAAAVSAASTWENYSAERMLSAKSGNINITIDDIGTPISSAVSVEGDMIVESVVVYLDLSSSSLGHLNIRLLSPQGTESILAPGMRPDNVLFQRWMLRTVRSWGESSKGQWTLSIADTEPGDVSGCIDLAVAFDEPTCADINTCETGNAQLDVVLAQACCKCGGGENASSVQDMLVSWTLIIYGHDLTGNIEPTVSPAPTFPLATFAPSPMVSLAPNSTQAVSLAPTSSQASSSAPAFLSTTLPAAPGLQAVSPAPTMPRAPGSEAGTTSNNFAASAGAETAAVTTEITTSSDSAIFTAEAEAPAGITSSSGSIASLSLLYLARFAWFILLPMLA